MVKPVYKQTEVGEIPEDWGILAIKDVTNDVGDGIHTTPAYSKNGEYYFINGNNISNGSIVINSDTKSVSELEFRKHQKPLSDRTVFLSINGTIGNVAFYRGEPIILGKSAAYLNFKNSTSKEYAYYILQTNSTMRFFKDGLTGTTIKNLGLGAIRNTLIPIPKENEQKSIAKALSDVDELIVSLEKLIAKKRDIKTAAMQQLLTGKKRLPGFGEGKGTKQTELGEIPEDWNLMGIPEITKPGPESIKIGPFGSSLKKEYLSKSGYKVYGQENVYEKDMTVGDRYLPFEHFHKLKSCKVEPCDFLISMMGTVGKCYTVPKDFEVGIIDSHLIRIRFDESLVSPEYLGHLFQSRLIEIQIKKLSVGGIMEGLSSKIIKQLLAPLGSIDEQNAIADFLSDLDKDILSIEQRLNKTKSIKQGMMQELLTGRTRLVAPEATAYVEEERLHGT